MIGFIIVFFLIVVMGAFVALANILQNNFYFNLVSYAVALSQGRLRPFVEEDDV